MRFRCLIPVRLMAGADDSPAGFVFDPKKVGMSEDEVAVNVERGILAVVDEVPVDVGAEAEKPKKGGRS